MGKGKIRGGGVLKVPNGTLQMKTVMQDVIRNMAFVVSCTTKNTILNTPNIFGKSAQSSYRDMTVGRSYRIDDDRILVTASAYIDTMSYDIYAAVYSFSKRQFGTAARVLSGVLPLNILPEEHMPSVFDTSTRVFPDTESSFIFAGYPYRSSDHIYISAARAVISGTAITVTPIYDSYKVDDAKVVVHFLGAYNGRLYFTYCNDGSYKSGWYLSDGTKTVTLSRDSINSVNIRLCSVDEKGNLFLSAYYGQSYRTKYFTGLLDSSLNIVSSDESFNDLVNSGSLAVFPIGHGRFVAYIPSSGGGIYEYGTGGLEKVAAIDGMMSPSNVNCILSLHDRASNRIMFACPSPAVADNMLIYDTAKRTVIRSRHAFVCANMATQYGFIHKTADGEYVVIETPTSMSHRYHVFDGGLVCRYSNGYMEPFPVCVVPGSVTPHGLEYVSEPNTRTGSDYIRLYRDNGVAERTTEPALNGMAVQKKRYLEEVKVYV